MQMTAMAAIFSLQVLPTTRRLMVRLRRRGAPSRRTAVNAPTRAAVASSSSHSSMVGWCQPTSDSVQGNARLAEVGGEEVAAALERADRWRSGPGAELGWSHEPRSPIEAGAFGSPASSLVEQAYAAGAPRRIESDLTSAVGVISASPDRSVIRRNVCDAELPDDARYVP